MQRPQSRRTFLASATLAVTSAPLLTSLDAAESTPADKPGWIDAHAHIWTTDLDTFPLANGQTVDDLKPREFTADQLIRHGAEFGVSRFVLIQHKPYHGIDNSYILWAIRNHPGVFSGVACINEMQSPGRIMRELGAQGIHGFRIRPDEGGADRWRDSPGIREMWKTAAQTGMAICPLIDPGDLPEVDFMCSEYPDTTVVVDHFARVGIDGTIHPDQLRALTRLARHPNAHVKVSAFYALGKKQPPYHDLADMIKACLQAFGPSRLMWATDCPYQLGGNNSYAASFELIHSGLPFLTDEDKRWLLRGTAEKVYFSKLNL